MSYNSVWYVFTCDTLTTTDIVCCVLLLSCIVTVDWFIAVHSCQYTWAVCCRPRIPVRLFSVWVSCCDWVDNVPCWHWYMSLSACYVLVQAQWSNCGGTRGNGVPFRFWRGNALPLAYKLTSPSLRCGWTRKTAFSRSTTYNTSNRKNVR